MNSNKYKNIQLTREIDNANCITHSGKFHVERCNINNFFK